MIMLLNSMKFRYFMLLVCVTLLLGISSCSNEKFEVEAPNSIKELSDAELIELTLSKASKTRCTNSFPIAMTTDSPLFRIQCWSTENIIVHLDDENEVITILQGDTTEYYHFFKTDKRHVVYLETSQEAIKKLDISLNDFTFLEIKNNKNLETLNCNQNNLESLDLSGCSNLKHVYATFNKLSTIDVSHLIYLEELDFTYNDFTTIDVSKNLNLNSLVLEYNPIRTIDVTTNTQLQTLNVGESLITNLDLTKNPKLKKLNISNLKLTTINNRRFDTTCVTDFPELEILNISKIKNIYLLDLSNNPNLYAIDIAESGIKILDISKLPIRYLNANGSMLEKLIYTSQSLQNLCYLLIQNTDLDNSEKDIWALINALPDRCIPTNEGKIIQGHIHSHSTLSLDSTSFLEAKNWILN